MIESAKVFAQAMNRRNFLGTTATGIAGVVATLSAGSALAQVTGGDSTAAKSSKAVVDKGPQIEAQLVKEFVRVSHFDLAAVQQMLLETPALLSASWDWGGGDFEAGIEAASHVGNREITLFFMSQGARPSIFTATMLGHIDIVKTFLTNYPYLVNCRGPHGLTLLHHAKKGADQAAETRVYLESLGAT